jgi:hypothetical protein
VHPPPGLQVRGPLFFSANLTDKGHQVTTATTTTRHDGDNIDTTRHRQHWLCSRSRSRPLPHPFSFVRSCSSILFRPFSLPRSRSSAPPSVLFRQLSSVPAHLSVLVSFSCSCLFVPSCPSLRTRPFANALKSPTGTRHRESRLPIRSRSSIRCCSSFRCCPFLSFLVRLFSLGLSRLSILMHLCTFVL